MQKFSFSDVEEKQYIIKRMLGSPNESLISNSLGFFLFFKEDLFLIFNMVSTLFFQSWSLLSVNLNSMKKDQQVHAVLYYYNVFDIVFPRIQLLEGSCSIHFGLVFSFLICVSFHMPCPQRACVLFCKVASLYTMNGVFGTSLTVRFLLQCLCRKR